MYTNISINILFVEEVEDNDLMGIINIGRLDLGFSKEGG